MMLWCSASRDARTGNVHGTIMRVKTMKKLVLALMVGALMGLAGCGGTGAGAEGTPQGSQTAADMQDLTVSLSASSQVLPSDGSAPVDLTAVLTDAETRVAIAGKVVSFAARDAANGVRIEVTRAETDASGVAIARLILDGDSTARDVTVLASVDQKTPAELVVSVAARAQGDSVGGNSRGELSIRLGTDNLIEDLKDQLSYLKRYAAIVSDNAGIPKPNANVSAVLRARRYYVGYWVSNGTDAWGQVHLIAEGIESEDKNNPGVCDPGEDVNGDGVLTPGNIASYTVESQTDANGVAVLNIVYPKSFAQWAQMELEVTAAVGGSEGVNAITIPLPILAADVTDPQIAPPSIARTRESLSTLAKPFDDPGGNGDEIALGGPPPPQAIVAGSPFPYLSLTRPCD